MTTTNNNVVLLGDSIFDNAPYVAAGDSVIEQLATLTHQSCALYAVDGAVLNDVQHQIEQLKEDKQTPEHIFVSCGGNDILIARSHGLLLQQCGNLNQALTILHEVRETFRQRYQAMLDHVLALKSARVTVCTIYDKVPNLSNAERTALALFNEVILYEASQRNLKVIDLRVLCDAERDYAPVSPIEPSVYGAKKIAESIVSLL